MKISGHNKQVRFLCGTEAKPRSRGQRDSYTDARDDQIRCGCYWNACVEGCKYLWDNDSGGIQSRDVRDDLCRVDEWLHTSGYMSFVGCKLCCVVKRVENRPVNPSGCGGARTRKGSVTRALGAFKWVGHRTLKIATIAYLGQTDILIFYPNQCTIVSLA